MESEKLFEASGLSEEVLDAIADRVIDRVNGLEGISKSNILVLFVEETKKHLFGDDVTPEVSEYEKYLLFFGSSVDLFLDLVAKSKGFQKV